MRAFPVSFALFGWLVAGSLTLSAQFPTESTYWNAKGLFAGAQACAKCHPAETRKMAGSAMSKALEPIAECSTFRQHPQLTIRLKKYDYSIQAVGGKVIYRVSDGIETIETPLEYAFGGGKAGQTYLFRRDGVFRESRVSYYSATSRLDLTVGAGNEEPKTLEDAAGRLMSSTDARNCFGCHTTGARRGTTLHLEEFAPGIQCESCHGPGLEHVTDATSGSGQASRIRSLRGMGPQDSNEFCGACHRTWETVTMMGIRGPNTARFPAYRLTSSKCFSLDDKRISCTACHDPHAAIEADDKAYDSKCQACHNAGNAAIRRKTCPRAKDNCTSCHMQRVESAEAHHAFRDHWIRIVKSKLDYPE